MQKKYLFKITFLFFTIALLMSNITAAELKSKDKVNIGETFTVTFDFNTYVAAYDLLEVTYNKDVLEYVSGDALLEKTWYDDTNESKGVKTKTYTFKGKKDGVASINVKVVGAYSANASMDKLDEEIIATKVVSVGSGVTKGDMDRNGSINATDAAYLLDRYTNNDATAEDIAIGDMDNKGDLNGIDAAAIIDLYVRN